MFQSVIHNYYCVRCGFCQIWVVCTIVITLLPFEFWGFWYCIYNTTVQSQLFSKEDNYNSLLKFNLLCFIRVNAPFLVQMTPIEVAAEGRHMDIVHYLRGCGMSDVSIWDSGSRLILISVWAGLFPGHLTDAVIALYNYSNNLYCIFHKSVICLIICYLVNRSGLYHYTRLQSCKLR